MRKTKIVCTIGPASENEQVLRQMCEMGMNVARLNFSHGSHEEHKRKLDLVKKVREDMNLPIAVMLDTKGPEYRIGTFENGKVTVEDGAEFTFTTEDIVGDDSRVSVSYKDLMNNLSPGDRILVNNGLVVFEVKTVGATEAKCIVISGGVLSNKKSMNFPGKVMKQDFLSENDRNDILWGIENDVDFIAASFVSTKEDILSLRNFLDWNGGREIEIIAKIENRSGVDNIESICEVADGIMVARGDLGVEIPGIEVPSVQKYLIQKCRLLGKRVITATEMLESMIQNPRPTRAEISDVANAVYDGTSAVMLSGETAAGKYPVEAVRTMAETVAFTEEHIHYDKRFKETEFVIKDNQDAVSHSSCAMAIDVNARCIVINTLSGLTARMVSRFRCPVDIIGMAATEKVWRKINLSWGVYPVMARKFGSMDEMFANDLVNAEQIFNLTRGDNIVVTGGMAGGAPGNTNLIQLMTV
ncbi:pyruvate kinase [Butyrivibrio sp. MC2013]|uniref:pyruvate kinase n=1 Tax=Butyrivibrio sp. MC2013 TaxID=1280686 RepID=UPI000418FF4B|nr:pyruvate kinase [Butyrivibrio sp. MC2013]